jgi:hypothetical protein
MEDFAASFRHESGASRKRALEDNFQSNICSSLVFSKKSNDITLKDSKS